MPPRKGEPHLTASFFDIEVIDHKQTKKTKTVNKQEHKNEQ